MCDNKELRLTLMAIMWPSLVRKHRLLVAQTKKKIKRLASLIPSASTEDLQMRRAESLSGSLNELVGHSGEWLGRGGGSNPWIIQQRHVSNSKRKCCIGYSGTGSMAFVYTSYRRTKKYLAWRCNGGDLCSII